ncbi:MAG: transglycosylase SLT domain-containing protein [Pyrinomonadaceae bacterium]|nr:transglycosylase SLT domain-containing protein [Pyrinomonadaceae bacterium]
MKKIYLVPLFFIFSFQIFAQDFRQKINQAVENRDYQSAITELKNLEKSDKKVFANNNYDYLLARMAEKRGDFALAMSKYQSVVKRNSILTEYALWHLSQIARSSGNLMLERTFLQQIITSAPNSLIAQAAYNRMSRSYFESKSYETAISFLQGTPSFVNGTVSNTSTNPTPTIFGNLTANDARTRENLVLLGNAFLQLKKTNEAREIFNKLVTTLPNATQPDDFALEAAKGLDMLDSDAGAFGKIAPNIADNEHFRRALIYQFNRNFAFARLHYQAIIEQYPQSPNVPDALYSIGRGYALEGSYNEAVKWFERTNSEFPTNPLAENALSQSASAYSRINKPKEAMSRYQRFIQQFPESDTLERAYLNIVDIERDLGESSDALKWTQKTRDAFKGDLAEALAVFAQARINIAENNWANALNDLNELQNFSDLGGTKVPGGTNKNEVAYLRAYTLEKLERYNEAIDGYLAIPDGRAEYYGWRATERLKALAADEKSASFITPKFSSFFSVAQLTVTQQNAESVRQSAQSALRLTNDENVRSKLLETVKKTYALLSPYQKIPNGKLQEFGRKDLVKDKALAPTYSHQSLADELLFLKLYDEGTPELETALREKLGKISNALSDFPPDVAYTLATFYKRGDMANRAIGYIEPLWKNVPADYQIELMPRDQIELLYPTPYADSLLKFSPERNVDPRFALSIMRQESRYRADVKSVAAARGLMQFISDTSNKIAAELGKKDFKQDELYNPPTAILFGSQYLGNLFKMFPNQAPAVAASYNGGEQNMTRWLARSKSDTPDRYVPEILFTQSKDYVYKVMANYRIYQIFYDDKLKAK